MHPDDDNPPPRPRWLGWALIAFGLLVALGMLNLGVRMVLSAKPAQADAPQQPTSTAPVAGHLLLLGYLARPVNLGGLAHLELQYHLLHLG